MINLFQRDFDSELTTAATAEVQDAVGTVASEPGLSRTEVERLLNDARVTAFREGVEAGRLEGRADADASNEARLTTALDGLRDHLTDLDRQVAENQRDIERDMVDLLLGVAERFVPELLDGQAQTAALSRIRAGLRMAAGSPTVLLRVAPDLEQRVRAELAAEPLTEMGHLSLDIQADARLSRSAARLEWRNGYLEYDMERACNDLLAAFRSASQQLNGPERGEDNGRDRNQEGGRRGKTRRRRQRDEESQAEGR